MTQESHAEYMKRKLSDARKAAEAKQAAAQDKRTAANAKRTAAKAKQAAERAAAKAEQDRLASLAPNERARELLKLQSKIDGVQVLWGNILNWTNGNCDAALTSRYQQAIRLRPAKLTIDEINEATEVVDQLIVYFVCDIKKYKKLLMVRLELKQHLSRILEIRSANLNAKEKSQSAAKRGVNIDNDLADSLISAVESARNLSGGYVYLKQWSLADGTRWLKIGITNNPDRRDAEQNVLPVPAVTLCLMETQSMDQAAAIERALHKQLAAQKVTGAGNRELFHLDDGQLAALMAAMES